MSLHTTQHFEMHKGDSKLLTITVQDAAEGLSILLMLLRLRLRWQGIS